MKAKYKAGRPEDNLTVGKKYDVEDVRCKKEFEASEVYLKNDKQQKCWYSVELFTMYAESALPLKMGAADAALGAAALAALGAAGSSSKNRIRGQREHTAGVIVANCKENARHRLDVRSIKAGRSKKNVRKSETRRRHGADGRY